uniref:TSA: Wollemia nobilis Ref_Wollemi_Transcript_816_2869 transcribed RNA sequence n=1 Tax=Wollemia nobilis TaxID=56998 RepID=A0A0C9QXW6_9CONI
MDLSSLFTSLGTSFLIFFVLGLVYAWLSSRPGNSVIYYPNIILRGLNPFDGSKTKTRSPFGWIVEAWQAKEDDIISVAGLDAAVYLRFIATALAIVLSASVLCLPLLIPLSVTDNQYEIDMEKSKNNPNAASYSDFDKLAMGNIKSKSARLWGFVAATYFVSVATYFILWKTYKHVLWLKGRKQYSMEAKPEQFVILVRDIPLVPPGETRKQQVDSFFKRLYPETFEQSLIVTDFSEANKVWTKIEGFKKKLARAEVIFEESKTKGKPEGTRPMHRTGFLGLYGKKVDSIDFCNEKIKDLTPKLHTKQKIALTEKQIGAAFIILNSRVAAASASQVVHSQLTDTWTVMAAPEPRQVLWKNLKIPFYQRMIREKIVYTIVFLTVVFYMIPITFLSAFTTLDNLKKLLPFLKGIVNIAALKSILEAYLPQIILILFLALLPMLLLALSKLEGIPSESHAVRAASGKYFYFIVFNVFLGVAIGGALFQSLKEIEKHPNKITDLLGKSLPPVATFFISFVALKVFVGYGLELSRVVPLIIYHIKRRFLCKTEAERREAWAPGPFSYATRVPNDMLIITIALTYSVIAPMILPIAILYFAVGWIVLRNQALKVYVPKYESNGRMWPHIHTRIVAALFLTQITLIGYFGVKEFFYFPVLLPLPFISLAFVYVCRKRFYTSFCVTSLEVASNDVKEVPSVSSIVEAYTAPCMLMEDKFDDIERYDDASSTISSRTSSLAK